MELEKLWKMPEWMSIEVLMRELWKGGGGPRCCTRPFLRDVKLLKKLNMKKRK
jgi:arginine deiminase